MSSEPSSENSEHANVFLNNICLNKKIFKYSFKILGGLKYGCQMINRD